ncbi:MAG: phosphotransferase [Pseudomonadota bacterium]
MTDDMADRAARARDFIDASDWANAPIAPFTGDASNRRYFRLVSAAGRRAVLMDAPPGKGEDIAPFISIAAWLRDLGLSAPALYAEDRANGFLLLEDLGDALYARAAKKGGMPERAAYLAAMDVLVSIARAQMPKAVAAYDTEAMAPLAGLAGTWYAGDDDLAKAVSAATAGALDALPSAKTTLVLRDYHAENLIRLPERAGAARVGLLDFQDARLGHPAYDLASLLHDARRDVPEEVQRALLQGFATAM